MTNCIPLELKVRVNIMPWMDDLNKVVPIGFLQLLKIREQTALINLTSDLSREELKSVKKIIIDLKSLVPYLLEEQFILSFLTELIEKSLLVPDNFQKNLIQLDSEAMNLLETLDLENFTCDTDTSLTRVYTVGDENKSNGPFNSNASLHLNSEIQDFADFLLEDFVDPADDKRVINTVEDILCDFLTSDTNKCNNLSFPEHLSNDIFENTSSDSSQSSPFGIDEAEDIYNELFNSGCHSSLRNLVKPIYVSDDSCDDIFELFGLHTSSKSSTTLTDPGNLSEVDVSLLINTETNKLKQKHWDYKKKVKKCKTDFLEGLVDCGTPLSPSFSITSNASSAPDKIYVRRIKNNIASKVTRAKRKLRHHELFRKAIELEKSNADLKMKIDVLQKEADELRELLVAKLSCASERV